MRLICPACGAIWSAEAGANDASCRTFMGVLVKLPGQVRDLALPYLGLFRQGAKGLSWQRALRVIADLNTMIEAGTVQWEGGESRPAPPELWARAIDAVLSRRPTALTNHNYLRHTAWEMARGMAAEYERQRERAARGREYEEEARDGDEPASEEDRAEMAKMLREWLGKK